MKVTFLIPPVLDGTRDVDRCFGCNYGIYFLPLLPVLYAATLIKPEVESVVIIDFAANKKTKQDFTDFIERDDSDVYVFYTVFLSQKTDIMARQAIRRIRKEACFIFCGPQPTFSPEAFLDEKDTFAVRGEPEFIIREAIRAFKSKTGIGAVNGLSYRTDSGIQHNPGAPLVTDIDRMPIPDRSMLDHKPYFNPKLRRQPHTAILTSRGCYGRCWFCVPNSLSYTAELEYKKTQGRKPAPRLHSAARVIEEFRNIASLGFRSVSVIDDEFLWDEKRTLEIAGGIKGLGLEWSCLARPDKVTGRAAEAMHEAGCAYVDLGTESFVQEVLDDIRKDMSVSDTENAVRALKKHRIQVEINVLLGATPKETEETIRRTLREIRKLNVDYALFSIANPFPGTDFYCAAKAGGWMRYGDYVPVDPARESIISYPHLPKEKLEKFVSYAYTSFYFNPRYLFRQIFRLKGFKDFRNKLSAAINLIKRNF